MGEILILTKLTLLKILLLEIHLSDVNKELEVSINGFKRYVDRSRVISTYFNPGDMVWISTNNLKSTRPTKEISERSLGPFPILKKFSTHSYHLKLPSQWNSIHQVFHISLLQPVETSSILNRYQEPSPPIIIEEKEEWEVSQILYSNLKRGKLLHLVEWKNYSQNPDIFTWESAKNLKNFPELEKDLYELYPENPGQ
ncbi:hypothetical protein O181_026363 [Austropuccinia psidii MF-1]|uniref:Chromo domain-containing protein n=1 Tax=Austropuccinia psidii MF-1 TaxID=1389203 RepID=A0A9Q3CMF3_9BASI|nr:hypothetical protein [Austropuccinia psidii MF-1]